MKKEGEVRIPSGCAIAALIDREGKKTDGSLIVNSMKPMHDRSNGLGGGFAAYGIYPQYKELYALHVFYDSVKAKEESETYLNKVFDVENLSRIPTRQVKGITDAPLIWRYFVVPDHNGLRDSQLDEKEYVAKARPRKTTQRIPG